MKWLKEILGETQRVKQQQNCHFDDPIQELDKISEIVFILQWASLFDWRTIHVHCVLINAFLYTQPSVQQQRQKKKKNVSVKTIS